MILGEIDAGFSILDRISNWWKGRYGNSHGSISTRFVELFQNHGVHRNQIPRFFGNGLTLADVQTDSALTEKLTDEIVDKACDLFAVRREWLDGAEPRVYAAHDFYKEPKLCREFVEKLRSAAVGELDGVLLAPESGSDGAFALLIFSEWVGEIGQKPIYRYHLCPWETFQYWKCRAYLAAAVSLAWKHKIYIRGVYASPSYINSIAQGTVLLGGNGEGPEPPAGKRWYAEDMALRPEVFLNGIDPEPNEYGIYAGLGLWLELEQHGWMDPGVGVNAGRLFEERLSVLLA